MLRRKLNLILITFLTINLYGCTKEVVKERVVYVPVPIEKPAKPELPKLSARELACLTDDTKNLLLKRDTLQKGYITDLESAIEATQKKR